MINLAGVLGFQIETMKLDNDLKSLVSILKEENPQMRKEAAKAIGQIGNQNCLKYLFSVLKDDSWGVRAVAVQSVGKIAEKKDKQSRAKIIDLLDDEDWAVRCAAIESLARISGPESIDLIAPAVMDTDPHVKETAFNVLKSINDTH